MSHRTLPSCPVGPRATIVGYAFLAACSQAMPSDHDAADVAVDAIAADDGTVAPPMDVPPPQPDIYEATIPDGWTSAPHDSLPQVPNQGGPTLASPELILVFYPGVADAVHDEAYARWLVGSSWMTSVGAEYGVGLGSVAATVHLTDSPGTSITSADIETFLGDGVQNGTLPQPADGLNNAIYVVYYPATTSVTMLDPSGGASSQSCDEWAGYHSEVDTAATSFSYAVIPDCFGFSPGITQQQSLDVTVSHEVIEASTDAFPLGDPAFQLQEDVASPSPWVIIGGEVADLCEGSYVRYGANIAQTVWSNAAAAADQPPCVPATGPYFNVSVMPSGFQTAHAGTTVTFALTGWSTAPTDDWTIFSMPWFGSATSGVTLNPMTMNNGTTGTMQITIPSGTPHMSLVSVVIGSAQSSGAYAQWPVAIIVE